ncbi:ubiquitin-like domain-containing CTD phosphatase 1 [Octopus vulgaris]|uniref:Ubiquitin-like domain-containing CTD phosphatase 1 n=2 Tax=Octopus TaxID=6643 RepID=A0AA36FCN9_OCTVU|nr:ubiquitin-like domain-containing CTD phosphatase 1 [Octopus sinensis]CAI9733265.1 ubiquitin-like domain-containing CTD phosphatase 1 [Octopus vulgaris]
MAADTPVEMTVRWSGNEYKLTDLTSSNTVADLKSKIQNLTGVLPHRQKLLGLQYNGRPPEDDIQLGTLKLKPNLKIMMMGSREDVLAEMQEPPKNLSNLVNDFEMEDEEISIENREEHLAKIEKRVRDYNVTVLNPPRDGKKLLVLDIDYTLFDHKSVAERAEELMRPFLHEFLTAAYEDYDIVIWSATTMKWIEIKMKELGVTSHVNYRITFMLDYMAMISVHTPKYGVVKVKPLGVIWGKFSHWSAKNTIMFDDVRRNFLMNPQSGLKIRPFKSAHVNRSTDRELLELSKYLKVIAPLEDFGHLKHSHWERYKSKRKYNDIASTSSRSSSGRESRHSKDGNDHTPSHRNQEG